MKLKQKIFIKIFIKTKICDCPLKDEFKRKIISELIGLQSKVNSLIAVDSEDVK